MISGLRLSLITDGKSDFISYECSQRYYLKYHTDSHHSKTRLREFEKVVQFGDTVQVSCRWPFTVCHSTVTQCNQATPLQWFTIIATDSGQPSTVAKLYSYINFGEAIHADAVVLVPSVSAGRY